jgi:hypothetical protein
VLLQSVLFTALLLLLLTPLVATESMAMDNSNTSSSAAALDTWEGKPLKDNMQPPSTSVLSQPRPEQVAVSQSLEIQLRPAVPFIQQVEKILLIQPLSVKGSAFYPENTQENTLFNRLNHLQVVLYGTLKTPDPFLFLKELTRLFPEQLKAARLENPVTMPSRLTAANSQPVAEKALPGRDVITDHKAKRISTKKTNKSTQSGLGIDWENVFETDPFFNSF